MTQIRLQYLKPGMVISKDALTHQGKLVFPRGTRLNQESIQMLKAWGIPEVHVLDQGGTPVDEEMQPTSNPVDLVEGENKIQALFAKSNTDHPAIQELMRLAVQSRSLQKE